MKGNSGYSRSTGGLAELIVRKRRLVVALWAVLAVILLPNAFDLADRLRPGTRLDSGEAARAEAVLRDQFAGPGGRQAILVIEGIAKIGTEPGRAVLSEIREAVAADPGVVGVLSALDRDDPSLLGEHGNGALLIVSVSEDVPLDVAVPSLRATTALLIPQIRKRFPDARLLWTGDLALDYDSMVASSDDVRQSELRALPIAFALLLWAFGAVVAAICPLLIAILAIGMALGVSAMVALVWAPSILLQSVVSLLGLALGIDYALLVVNRFREQLAEDPNPVIAAEQTVRHAGRSVVLSGAAVAIGFSALLIVPVQEPQSVGIGGLLVTLFSVLLATTLLPALLVWLGPRIDLGRMPWRSRRAATNSGWRRWGLWVTRRPVVVFLCATAPLLAMAWPAQQMKMSLPDEGWLPRATEAARGIEALERMGRSGLIYRIRVLFQLPEGTLALSAAGWPALQRLQRHLDTDPRVQRSVSLASLAGPDVPLIALQSQLPESVKSRFLSRDGSWALFEVVPDSALGPGDMMDLVAAIRRTSPDAFTGGASGRFLVGGLPAAAADYVGVIVSWLPGVVALVVGGTFLALLVGFRSLMIPLKAVVLNLLSVGAAFGALQVVFLMGYGVELFGLSGPVGGVFPAIPMLVFCTVFGISMDYEVFLLSRVAEARRQHHDEANAISEGLAQTAGLITSAAAIMIVVFGAFTLGQFLPVQMLGFTLAIAVLLDATLVRIALGPALLRLAGRWNWWPGHADAVRSSSEPG